MTTTSNPLQLGQTLYELNDLTVICPVSGNGVKDYHRFSYDGNGNGNSWSDAAMSLSGGGVDNMLDARAVNVVASSKQVVLALGSGGLTVLSANELQTFEFSTTGMQYIIDSNPNVISSMQVLLAGQTGSTASLWTIDSTSGQLSNALPFSLPSNFGTTELVGACLCRCQTSARLIGFFMQTSASGCLLAADFGADVLSLLAQGQYTATTIAAQSVVSITSCLNGSAISYTAGSLKPQSNSSQSNGNQQLAISYPYSASSSSYGFAVSVLDFDMSTSGYPLSLIDHVTAAVACVPEQANAASRYQIASGSLLDNGLEQIVVACSGSYGSPVVAGCVSLTLLQYTSGGLTVSKEFVGCNYGQDEGQTVPLPFCSLGLNVSAGLYGTASSTADVATLGVAVVGCGGNLQNLAKNQAQLCVAVVPLDPATAQFVATPADKPVDLHANYGCTVLTTVAATSPGYVAFPSDVTGNSVVLGPPVLTTVSEATQILAYIQAMPFENNLVAGTSTVTFTESAGAVDGYSVSSSQTWTLSNGAGANLELGGFSVSALMENTYTLNFSNMIDSSQSKDIVLSSSIENEDMIIVFNRSYQVWTYPLYQPAVSSTADGSVAVIFPTSTTDIQSVLPANDPDYGYIPVSQPGLLISYQQTSDSLSNFTEGSAIFMPEQLPVLSSGSSTLTYSASDMVSTTQSATSTIFNSLSVNASAGFNADLFDYLPSTFGLDVSESASYEDSNTTTTTSSYTSSFSLSFSTGTVKGEGYAYLITPYVYFDNVYGCLMVSYTVDLSAGTQWDDYYSQPNVVLITTFPFDESPLNQCFSRGICFTTDDDGNTIVQLAAFNAAMVSANGISFDVYAGQPVIDNSGSASIAADAVYLGSYQQDSMVATERLAVNIPLNPGCNLQDGDEVSVAITSKDGSSQVYWGVYPLSAFPAVVG